MADEIAGEIDQPRRHAGRVHQLTRQHEQRNSQQREIVDDRQHALRHDIQRARIEQGNVDESRKSQHHGDRDAGNQQHGKQQGNNDQPAFTSLPVQVLSRSATAWMSSMNMPIGMEMYGTIIGIFSAVLFWISTDGDSAFSRP